MKYFQNYFFQKHDFSNYHKIVMISVDLGLHFVPQVFNIFEKRLLSAQRTFVRTTENIFWVDYNDSCEKRVQSCLKVSKTLEKHATVSNIFWSEAAMSGANS